MRFQTLGIQLSWGRRRVHRDALANVIRALTTPVQVLPAERSGVGKRA